MERLSGKSEGAIDLVLVFDWNVLENIVNHDLVVGFLILGCRTDSLLKTNFSKKVFNFASTIPQSEPRSPCKASQPDFRMLTKI